MKADDISSIFKCVCCTQCHHFQSFDEEHKEVLSGGLGRRGMVSFFLPHINANLATSASMPSFRLFNEPMWPPSTACTFEKSWSFAALPF